MFDIMSTQQTRFVDKALRQLLSRSEARAVLLANEAGYILAEQAYDDAEEFTQGQNIAALASGSFFATREMARIVGEGEFKCVLHQGSRSGIFIMLVAASLILVVIFDRNTNPGLVKLLCENTANQLETLLAQEAEATEEDSINPATFKLNTAESVFEQAP